jgi:hypothetical protein
MIQEAQSRQPLCLTTCPLTNSLESAQEVENARLYQLVE